MNNTPWHPPSRNPGAAAGSVKKARDRAEAARAPARTPAPNPPSRIRPPMPAVFSGPKSGQLPIGMAISKPTAAQASPWPLAGAADPGQGYQPPAGRGPAPQRPPRPIQVPGMFETSQLEDPSPTSDYGSERQSQGPKESPPYTAGGRREVEDAASPDDVSPIGTTSRPSTISSVGSIPDFPVPEVPPLPPVPPVPPVPPAPPRRTANLGPPPSSRRGTSLYYSHASFVSPIPEESPRSQSTHHSYASSAAIPMSWGSRSPRSPDDASSVYSDEDAYGPPGFHPSLTADEMQDAAGPGDHDGQGLIRSASFGRRAKPSMVTTKSSEKTEFRAPPDEPQGPRQQVTPMGDVATSGAPQDFGRTGGDQGLERPESQRGTAWPMMGNTNSPRTGYTANEAAPAYTFSDPKAHAMMGAYTMASSLGPPTQGGTRTPSPAMNNFGPLSAMRRPPRVDMDAAREAEVRGSSTSLPELIKRATRLAAMMDRGRRPSSKMALDDFPSEIDFQALAREKEMNMTPTDWRRSATAMNNGTTRVEVSANHRQPDWSGPSAHERSQDPNTQQPGRRCCGLPNWAFLLILLLLLAILAAAIIVPLKVLVLDKDDAPTTIPMSPVERCAASALTACSNGGTSIIDKGACACLCTNGFTGTTCASANATGCSTVSLSGSTVTNVTVGESVPRVIAGSMTNFSVPLDETTILTRFNSAGLSCATENALLTFQGNSERLGDAGDFVTPSRSSSSALSSVPSLVAAPLAERRRDLGSPMAADALATPNPDYHDISTRSTTPPASPPPSSIAAQPTPSPSPEVVLSGVYEITEESLDFARVAVLYVLQEGTVDDAIAAQVALNAFFRPASYTNLAARNISVGGVRVVNLLEYSVNVGAGDVGSRPSGRAARPLGIKGRSVDLFAVP
ncbi:hypothetical protein LZ554_005492 [Drepanopeziza brunnea f. sp. 'monogermtubi']|nr:hypothetical protein LZ554_005492 [Drepanopeziza brunnea f. sp. 'monogermtubi']